MKLKIAFYIDYIMAILFSMDDLCTYIHAKDAEEIRKIHQRFEKIFYQCEMLQAQRH